MSNAFNWRGQPSIFSNDPVFTGFKNTGKTPSETATIAVENVYASGKNHGTLRGISKSYDSVMSAREFHLQRTRNKKPGGPETVEPILPNDASLFREARQAIAKAKLRRNK